MTINELLALNNLTANDQIPVWDAEATGSTEPTAKITAQNFANAVKSLASLIGTADLDATPTQGSTKAVQSGGVFDAIAQSTATDFQTEYNMEDKPTIQAGIESVIDALPIGRKNWMFMCYKNYFYTVIAQKYASADYASYIAISYTSANPLYGRKSQGVWTHYKLQATQTTN